MNSKLKVKGVVTITRDGHDPIVVNNLVVNTGLSYFINRILGDDANEIGYIAIGNGTEPAVDSDTGLSGGLVHNENYRTLELLGTNTLLVESRIQNDFTGNEISEIGLFTANGTMIARTVLPITQRFTKLLNEDISVVWNIKLGKGKDYAHKIDLNLTANGSSQVIDYNVTNVSEAEDATVAIYGDFGGGTLIIEVSYDNGTTWIPLKPDYGVVIEFTENTVHNTFLAPCKMRFTLSGATSPDLNITLTY